MSTNQYILPYPRTAAYKKVALAVMGLIVFVVSTAAQTSYEAKYRRLADSLSGVYHIPASIILGVAFIESGGGNSKNARRLNNHFGIVGPNNLGKKKGIKSRYRQYPSVAASYVSFCNLMTRKKFYNKLKSSSNIALWADAISKSGYSEAPVIWKKRLLDTIKKHHL